MNLTIDPVGKKKPSTDDHKPAGDRHLNPALGIRIPADLLEQMRASARRNRRTLTAEVCIAFEAYLEKSGLWPPS